MAIKVRQTNRLSLFPFLRDIFHVVHHSPWSEEPHGSPFQLFPYVPLGLLWVDCVARCLRVQKREAPGERQGLNVRSPIRSPPYKDHKLQFDWLFPDKLDRVENWPAAFY